MIDLESQIWSGDGPKGDVPTQIPAIARAVSQDVEYRRCSKHGIRSCMACAVKARDTAAQELAVAENTLGAVPRVVTAAEPATPPSTPSTPAEVPAIVQLAQDYANAVQELHQQEQLLITAELRVQMLKDAIESSKVAVEESRLKLAGLVSTGERA